MKKRIYIDLDGVVVDIESYIRKTFSNRYIKEHGIGTIIDMHPQIFYDALPMPGAVASFRELAQRYDVADFQGTHIHFGSEGTPDWDSVMQLFDVIEE